MNARDTVAVDVPQLRVVLDGLLEQVECEFGRQVRIGHDHYWLVELASAFSADLRPPTEGDGDLGVGQVSDDVGSIAEAALQLDREGRVDSLWHELEHAVGLLRALARVDLPDHGEV